MEFGQTSLSGVPCGFMPPQLKTKQLFQNSMDPFTYAMIMGDREDESFVQQYLQKAKSYFARKQSNTYQRQAENR